MDNIISSLISPSFFVFSLVIALAVISIRSIIEKIFKSIMFSILPDKIEDIIKDLWREWILRALPIGIGGLLAIFVTSYPVPDVFVNSESGRLFFGLIAGLFSSTIYSFTKFHLRKYLPKKVKTKVIPSIKNKE